MNYMILTDAGRELLALALQGYELHFSHGALGDGSLGSLDPKSLTNLIHHKLDMPIISMRTTSIGTCELVFNVNNKGLTEGFYLREYGVFATHPVSGKAVLYAYCNNADKSAYLEKPNGVYFINFSLTLTSIIDQAQNVTARIDTLNDYVTTSRLEYRLDDFFAADPEVFGVWTYGHNSQKRFTPTTWADFKKALLGTTDITSINSRLEHLEDNMASVLFSLESISLNPDCSHIIFEDFKNSTHIDTFYANVSSALKGDDTIICDNINGLLPGSIYTLSDGINSEYVQIRACENYNDSFKLYTVDTIKNTYSNNGTALVRTSAHITSEGASSSDTKKVFSWTPNFSWTGQDADSDIPINLDLSIANSQAFILSGYAALNTSGYLSLGA